MPGLKACTIFLFASYMAPFGAQDNLTSYVGSFVCGKCHRSQFQSQGKTGHAHALRRAEQTDPGPGSHAQWAFGAGAKAITWVSQISEDSIAEHGLSYYVSTKSLGITPGHTTSADRVYRTFDPVATVLRCFRCHSTGPIRLGANFRLLPSEPGVHCEACHGPGRKHAESGGASPIQNPARFTAMQINILCGTCHRQASDLDDNTDWSNAWNVRHEPAYLHRSACFRNSNGALSCITCHDPHQLLETSPSSYDERCLSCHSKVVHIGPISFGACIDCHMPQVVVNTNLKFTNHWIGIYDPSGRKLIPSKRVVKYLKPAHAKEGSIQGVILPADLSTLIPVYVMALGERERLSGPDNPKVARAASDLGSFLLELNESARAEEPLRLALAIDKHNADPTVDADRETLARALEAQGKRSEAFDLFTQAAKGKSLRVASRSFVKLAEMDRERADVYYQSALAAEEEASGKDSPHVALIALEYALELRARSRDQEAEPLLWRALSIQQTVAQADPQVTVEVLNTLGNLLEDRRELDLAERLERTALTLSEDKFGPESVQLAMTCTNLADVLWNKRNVWEAGELYRHAINIDASLYGPDRPETAADIANLGMLMSNSGQRNVGIALLKQALTIYEKWLGPDSDQARFVRQQIAQFHH